LVEEPLSYLIIEHEPPVRHVRLDTGKRNVLTVEAVEALRQAIAPSEDAPVVILSGRPDGFCAGLDNATLTKGALERQELLTRMAELLLDAIEGPTRIVAACGGHAVAAGAMLLLVADIRIGSRDDYKVGFTEPRLGMPLPELPALLARERLDRRRLHELTVLGRILEPAEAVSAGFFDALVETDRLEAVALERAHEISGLTDEAYRGSLTSVWGSTLERIKAIVASQTRRLAELSGNAV